MNVLADLSSDGAVELLVLVALVLVVIALFRYLIR